MDIKDNKKVQKNIQKEEINELKNEIEQLKKQVEEFKNKYLRALADYQNYEKRVSEEKKELIKSANTNLILRLLPFLDHLEKAEIFIKDNGLKLIKNNLYQVLTEIGIREIQIKGKEFDPHLAEAIDVIEGDKDNIVVEVLRKGYRYNDRILRVAQVKVSKKKIDQKAEEQAKGELLKGDYM